MKYTFRILRFDPTKDAAPRFQNYIYEPRGKTTVLEALMDIRNEQDYDLSFRYSCREGVCGSCGMVINGRFDLACRTMLDTLEADRVVLEPLPNLEVKKDLVVDMTPFWKALEAVKPYLIPPEQKPEREFPVEDREMEKIDQYVACILCACCYGACPVVARDGRYLGPAALAKLNRFVRDPRDRRTFRDWAKIDAEGGLWGCDKVFRCNEACPRQVRPADGIASLRMTLTWNKIKRMFRRDR
ncbi:MAG: succinate dehydrogenase iron-sulfur subunit [Candidatus Aminicenantes bacterium]|nr:succinate dehydrogenase iron-sulfur subunit [Candidatus Aminicenantes bacterium]